MFLAGLGGIYSLFIGMSAVTFFEVLYFFTVRLRATYLRLQREQDTVRVFAKRSVQGQRQMRRGKRFQLSLGHE